MSVPRLVAIDCFPESVSSYAGGYAVVAIDVIRATTTAVTAVDLGRRCFPVPSLEAAVPVAAWLNYPLLAGELGGNMPYGFHITNSPAQVARRSDIDRPMILLSTSGTQLICNAAESQAMYVACLRNYSAQIEYLVDRHPRVAIIGAGSRAEFREEDQLGCALVAAGLLEAGYQPVNEQTRAVIDRWAEAPVEAILGGKSAEYLRRSGQDADLEFVLTHINDLSGVYRYQRGEITAIGTRADLELSATAVEAAG
ncbi:MAG: 2-phosphosulfolactate phosphatase [Chloroflexota bacterium]